MIHLTLRAGIACLLYFDLDWYAGQPTVIQLLLRYSVEIRKCTNASDFILPPLRKIGSPRMLDKIWE